MRSEREQTAESGTLSLTLGYPAGAFLYGTRSPKVLIDGAEVSVPSWGTHLVPIPAGRHRLQVWVSYFLPRRAGKAQVDVTIPPGEEVKLEYVAPAITFARGSLGTPGEQKSSGYSAIMLLNVLVVIAVILLLVFYVAG